MFILNHNRIYICRGETNTRILILEEACPATSYIATTFHPTIGQCAHKSLSTPATPEMGMISTRNWGTTSSHITKHIKTQPSQSTVGFIRLLRQWKGRIAKLVSSTTELWTPSLDLSSLASTIPTHPTQGSIPFTATQSLRPYLPF